MKEAIHSGRTIVFTNHMPRRICSLAAMGHLCSSCSCVVQPSTCIVISTFLTFSPGTHLGIAGGFYDAINDNKSPVVLQLGGYVNLQHDYVGRNLREGVNTLWALHEAVKQIPTYVFVQV